MGNEAASRWAREFEGKLESEIPDVPPVGLSGHQLVHWKIEQQRAKRAALERAAVAKRREAAPARDVSVDDPRSPMQPLIDNLRERMVRAQSEFAAPPQPVAVAEIVPPQQPLVLPQGDAAQLLEQQLASSAALIAHLANYIARADTYPEVCTSFMDRMTAMLGASAHIGKVVGRLRGQVSESKQTITVERKQTGGMGEGVLET